jgi:hypothetical protein
VSTLKRVWPVLALLFAVAGVRSVQAQVISPGDLIAGHAPWDRIDSCISCHQLGTKSIDDNRCLSCHTPLRDRIDQSLGLHATYDEPNCATCHKDHFGRDFDPIRFDTLGFDHGLTGYDLIQSHTEVACASCHTSSNLMDRTVVDFLKKHRSPANTFLGLDETCASCHTPDNVHGTQFDQVACSTCHDQNVWEEAPEFDHNQADYVLTGEHTTVECAGCHEKSKTEPDLVLYKPIAFTECSNCHEDEHKGAFGATCTSCHSTKGWETMVSASFEQTFDHNSTDYPLIGLHQSASCASCHNPKSKNLGLSVDFVRSTLGKAYPHPIATECQNCHDDAHAGSVTTTESCASCHNEKGWAPSEFDGFRHQDETDFPLEGAHMAVLCSQCHSSLSNAAIAGKYGNISFSVENKTCEGCHVEDNIHGDQFAADTCDSCHSNSAWKDAEVSFDHTATDFPLLGAHAIATCISCHVPDAGEIAPYRELAAACISCHEADSPHEDQFAQTGCETCHDSESFRMSTFDHNTTNWPLEGAHTTVSCASCHTTRISALGNPVVQYRGIGTTCQDCHGGDIPDEK